MKKLCRKGSLPFLPWKGCCIIPEKNSGLPKQESGPAPC